MRNFSPSICSLCLLTHHKHIGTLAVRLSANIIAGHLLITLLGNTGPSLSYLIVIILIIGQIALLTLESAVAIIQSYVFAVLSTLYSSEVN